MGGKGWLVDSQHGWIVDSVKKMVTDKYGEEMFEKIKSYAAAQEALKSDEEISKENDKSDKTFVFEGAVVSLVVAASAVLKEDANVILEEIGKCFMFQVRFMGYDNLLGCHGTTLRSWLESVNLLHDHLQSTMPAENFLFPVIYCIDNPDNTIEEKETDEALSSFIIQYNSPRGTLYNYFLKGLIKDASEYYFNLKISMDLIGTQGENGEEYTSWVLKVVERINTPSPIPQQSSQTTGFQVSSAASEVSAPKSCPFSGRQLTPTLPKTEPAFSTKDEMLSSRASTLTESPQNFPHSFTSNSRAVPSASSASTTHEHSNIPFKSTSDIGLSSSMLDQVFPFFIKFDQDFKIESMGPQLGAMFKEQDIEQSDNIQDYFDIVKPPHIGWNWEKIQSHIKTSFELEIRVSSENENDANRHSTTSTSSSTSSTIRKLQLIGGLYVEDGKGVFLVQPAVYSNADLRVHKLQKDIAIPRHSLQRRLIMVGEHLKSEAYQTREFQMEVVDKEKALEMKRLFVRYVSHEIRTPLNTVSIGLELIQSLRSSNVIDKLLTNALNKSHDQSENYSSRLGATTLNEDSYDDPINTHLVNEAMEGYDSIFEMANEVKQSCDIAVSILNDLLLYEKIEGGILALECGRHPAVGLVFETARLFGVQSKATGIELKLSYDEEQFRKYEDRIPSIFVNVDKPKFTQVLRNLLSNAIKFSPENSIVNVCVSIVSKVISSESMMMDDMNENSSVPKRYVHIEVQDSGAGMSKDNLDKLFGNIVQFDAENLQGGGGSGIGLFVSKGIMDLHGGFIGASSQGVGKGSTFFVEVPILEIGSLPVSSPTESSFLSSRGFSNNSSPRGFSSSSSHFPSFSGENALSAPMISNRFSSKESISPRLSQFMVGRLISDQMHSDRLALSRPTHSVESISPMNSRSSTDSHGPSWDSMIDVASRSPTNAPPKPDHKKLVFVPEVSVVPSSLNSLPQDRKVNQSSSDSDGFSLKVLLVDDSSSTRKMLSRYLRMSKICEPDEACDGLEAVEKVKQLNIGYYHVILMDFIMPVLEGPAATEKIRELGYKGLVIGLTGQVRPEEQQLFKKCGADHVLAKPVDLATLRSLLASVNVCEKPEEVQSTPADDTSDETPRKGNKRQIKFQSN